MNSAATVKLSCESFLNRLLEDRYCIFLLDETCNPVPVYRGKPLIFRALPLTKASLFANRYHDGAARQLDSWSPAAAQPVRRGGPCRTAATVHAELNIFISLLFCPFGKKFPLNGEARNGVFRAFQLYVERAFTLQAHRFSLRIAGNIEQSPTMHQPGYVRQIRFYLAIYTNKI